VESKAGKDISIARFTYLQHIICIRINVISCLLDVVVRFCGWLPIPLANESLGLYKYMYVYLKYIIDIPHCRFLPCIKRWSLDHVVRVLVENSTLSVLGLGFELPKSE